MASNRWGAPCARSGPAFHPGWWDNEGYEPGNGVSSLPSFTHSATTGFLVTVTKDSHLLSIPGF